MNISRNITLVRHLTGLTQTDFGKLIGASKAMVISYEKGKAEPKPLLIQRISDLSGVSIDDLYRKALKEADITIRLEKVEKNNPEQVLSSELTQDGRNMDSKDLSNRAIYNLTESTRIIAQANSKLVDQSFELTMMVKTTVGAQQESNVNADARFSDLLEVIGVVGTKRGWWQSTQEAAAELSKLFYGKKESMPSMGTPIG